MGNERALDLGGAHAVAGDVDDIIHSTGNPIVAIGVAPGAIAGEVHAFEGRKIRLSKAMMIAVDRPHLPRPAVEQHEVPLGHAFQDLPLAIDQRRPHAGQWQRGGARLLRDGAGQRGD